MQRVGRNRRRPRPTAPSPQDDVSLHNVEYAGFWIRFVAVVIDIVILSVPTVLIGPSLIFILLIIAYHIIFWQIKQATLGKMAVSVVIVDAKTHGKPSMLQWILRYVFICISSAFFMIGHIIAAFHPQKRALHDLVAGTVVIYK